MQLVPRGSSAFSAAVGFFTQKPTKVKTHTVRKTTARIVAKSNKSIDTSHHQHRSASIVSAGCGCAAAREIEGTRYLVQDVPTIPLPDCTSPICKCSYVRHNDRRGFNEDRRALYSLKTDLHALGGDEERREKEGRRQQDAGTFAASDAAFDIAEWAR